MCENSPGLLLLSGIDRASPSSPSMGTTRQWIALNDVRYVTVLEVFLKLRHCGTRVSRVLLWGLQHMSMIRATISIVENPKHEDRVRFIDRDAGMRCTTASQYLRYLRFRLQSSHKNVKYSYRLCTQ